MNAITWLEQKSSHTDHGLFEEDGETYHQSEGLFRGRLPYRMVRDIQAYAKSQAHRYRDCGRTSLYNWSEDNTSYTLTAGTYKSTVRDVVFTYCRTVKQ
jgi:hypothetical protein